MSDLRLDELTEAERLVVVNGCGSKYAFRVPDFHAFGPACAQHDLGYWQGGTAQDRLRYDRAFLADMLAAARGERFWRRLGLRLAAWVYYAAVRAGGGASFHGLPRRGRLELLIEAAARGA